ncbi:MAG: Asp-tRNA(Asn)/Glu-tRNA(Gln) amidotransferase subunit GatC [Chloroflexota bacterium]
MTLSRDEVAHVARLAHIGLREDETDVLTIQLSSVIDHVAKLSEVDTSAVESTAHIGGVVSVMREDEARPSWDREAVLANAPRSINGYVEVQAVLD